MFNDVVVFCLAMPMHIGYIHAGTVDVRVENLHLEFVMDSYSRDI
jgi:hypothetical protein